MKKSKQRVIAIDYFRGVCILGVVISHAQAFSMPFAYLTGLSLLWTSAAEMFFLLSGVTFAIIRGPQIMDNFRAITKKTWRRAGIFYLINCLIVLASVCLGLLITSHGRPLSMPGPLPTDSSLPLLWHIATFSYTLGFANFLMFYAVFLMLAPLALYALKTRFWPVIPLASMLIFGLNASHPIPASIYSSFAVWQAYFFIGLSLGRFRVPIIGFFYGLKNGFRRAFYWAVVGAAGAVMSLSVLMDFNIFPHISKLADVGWLPAKLISGYSYLLQHRHLIDLWLLNGRTGILRPLVSVLVLAAAYLLYQKHKQFLLAKTGGFVIALGRDTLWIFVAQALLIPILAALPRTGLLNNVLLTAFLVLAMWMITQRKAMKLRLGVYFANLGQEFYRAKQSAAFRQPNEG